jgi:N-acyl-D-amino-acid deacylase
MGPTDRMPHPRNYGTFSRLIGHYSRDEGVVPLHTAIYKISKLPAERIHLSERGRIEVGAYADIAVLDLDEVIDTATFDEPHQYAKGAHHIFVNGQAVLLNGSMTGERPGIILRATD